MGTWVRADTKMESPGGHVYGSSAKAMPKKGQLLRSGWEDFSNLQQTSCYANLESTRSDPPSHIETGDTEGDYNVTPNSSVCRRFLSFPDKTIQSLLSAFLDGFRLSQRLQAMDLGLDI